MEYYSIDRKEFHTVTRYLYRVISADFTRPTLHQLCISRKDNVVTMAATDGHRVHRMHQQNEGEDFRFTLPRSFVSLLSIERDCLKEDIAISNSAGSPMMLNTKIHNHVFTITMAEYDFPPVEQTIPSAQYVEDTVNTRAFSSVLRAAAKLMTSAKRGSNMVKISDTAKDPRVLVFMALDDQYRELAVLASKANSGAQPISTKVNVHYLIEAVKPLKCETVNIKWLGPLDPIVITTDKQDATKGLDWSFDSVIMPLRI